MLGTDLKVHGNGNWDRAVTEGSRSILVWESEGSDSLVRTKEH